jgi:two-component system alkaline phosphatase synthesis response regulator PhoP
MTRVLVVEDEPNIAFALEADLSTEGYTTTVAGTGADALAAVARESFDLVLLDVMLPGKDGFDVCRELRRSGQTMPIILLTARTHNAEKVMGLDLGADDYVTKPFDPHELRARIRAVLRRSPPAGGEEPGEVYRFGDTEVDFSRAEVRRGGTFVDLSALEFKLLSTFVKSRGRLFTRDQLLDAVWGPGVSLNDRVVDNLIVSLRRKIEAVPAEPKHLKNIRGLGYRFDA